MADWAYSDDPQVQFQLDRLNRITPGRDVLGRSRLRRLLDRLGNPERSLPPVFHVAGTNGKGSTCTYLRGAIAASGMRAHVYTSPHLVRLNERIRVANHLIEDAPLAAALAEVIDAVGDDDTTFFEATTAAAFLVFARTPADACIVEVGIGGRLDATNVIPDAVACGIAQLGYDHQSFLGDTIESIAAEKAGIARASTPLITQIYEPSAAARVAEIAQAEGAELSIQGRDWFVEARNGQLAYSDHHGALTLPLPALAGSHQLSNAGLAIAMLRSQTALSIEPAAIATALTNARWPARLEQLSPGPLRDLLPSSAQLWLDGAHNPAAMGAVAAFLRAQAADGQAIDIILGLLKDKDLTGVLCCFTGLPVRFHTVPIPSYESRSPDEIRDAARSLGFTAESAADVSEALTAIANRASPPPLVLITGSLYLAGVVLRANGELPD